MRSRLARYNRRTSREVESCGYGSGDKDSHEGSGQNTSTGNRNCQFKGSELIGIPTPAVGGDSSVIE